MTKRRAPLSIHAALIRVVGQLPRDWDEAAEITGKQAGTLRAYADPERREELPVTAAIALDLAYLANGGDGTPIFDAYAQKLDLAELAQFADRIELHRKVVDVVREGGEAHAALVRACQPEATASDRDRAAHEASQAYAELGRVLSLLTAPNRPDAPKPAANERAPP